MEYIATSLRHNPELAIFLTLALGFLVGRIRIGSFSLGNVVGTLLSGVLIGQLDIKVAPSVKVVFFDVSDHLIHFFSSVVRKSYAGLRCQA